MCIRDRNSEARCYVLKDGSFSRFTRLEDFLAQLKTFLQPEEKKTVFDLWLEFLEYRRERDSIFTDFVLELKERLYKYQSRLHDLDDKAMFNSRQINILVAGKIIQNVNERRDGERLREKILRVFDTEMNLNELIEKLSQISNGALLKDEYRRPNEGRTTRVFWAKEESGGKQRVGVNNSYREPMKPRYAEKGREEARPDYTPQRRGDEVKPNNTFQKKREEVKTGYGTCLLYTSPS